MRLLIILKTIAKYRLFGFFPHSSFGFFFKTFFFWQLKIPADTARGVALRNALNELGPVFIKLGQMFSIRRDMLAEDLAAELEKLQDRVPPEPWPVISAVLNNDDFVKIDKKPLASASIAQVYRAIDHKGRKCVIKVVRPGIEKLIRRDMRLAKLIARFLHRFSREARRLKLPEVIADYDKLIHDELDLSREAANMSEVKRNFSGMDVLTVPEVYWDLCSEKVLAMEEVGGIPVNDIAQMKKQKVNFKRLAELGVEIFFTQVFRDNFFHADMHPGNIFVNATDPDCPSYVAVDFGIMGSLSAFDQIYLAESLLAFFNHDYQKLADVYIRSGWVAADTGEHELKSAFRTALEPVAMQPIANISLARVLIKLFKVSRRFGMEIQPQLVLLDKTLLYVEGLGKQIYPELDLWRTAKPFLEQWMNKKVSLADFLHDSYRELPRFIKSLPEAPADFNLALKKLAHGNNRKSKDQDKIQKVSLAASSGHILGGSMLIAAVLLFNREWFYLAGIFFIIALSLIILFHNR